MFPFPLRSVPSDGVRRALGLLVVRYLRQLSPLVRAELAGWRARALGIPDPVLRRLAADRLIAERANAEGAAVFASLAAPRWMPLVVRTSVAYQVMYDYLDLITEQTVPDHSADCALLHRAVVEAVDIHAQISDWYALHPRCDDGGYLERLVATCRSACASLPSYPAVAPYLTLSARRASEVQTLAHCTPDDAESLRRWAAQLTDQDTTLTWFEHAAGASSTLDLHTLLALAADDDAAPELVASTVPHLTAICALNTQLESLVDLPADRHSGDYSYISHYASQEVAAARLAFLARRAMQTAATTRRPSNHAAVLIAMASLYLARSEAWRPEVRPAAQAALAELRAEIWPLILLQRIRRLIPGA